MLLLNGCCRKQMKKLQRQKIMVDAVVTDPPYHLTSIVERFGKDGSAPAQFGTDGAFKRASTGFMGKEWDGGDIAFDPMTWSLCLGLLKPGGHLIAFSASRNYHRMAVAIEDAGFEIRDQIMWIYGSGFPKSLNLGDGWGTALKPAHEPIVMAKKRLEGTNKQNKDKYGTGGINIDGCRIKTNPEVDDMLREVERVQRDESNVWSNKNSGFKNENNNLTGVPIEGRFPANVMHDGSDVVKDIFPNSKGFVSNGDAKVGETSKGAIPPLRRGNATSYGDDGSAARYFYCPKTSKSERNVGLDNFTAKPMAWGNQAKAELKRGNLDFKGNQGDGSKHNKVEMRLNTHPTVKPVELMKYLCRLVTPKGGVVLDPFMGSGSTGMAAKDEGFDFIGIEKDEEYFKICESRIVRFAPLMDFM